MNSCSVKYTTTSTNDSISWKKNPTSSPRSWNGSSAFNTIQKCIEVSSCRIYTVTDSVHNLPAQYFKNIFKKYLSDLVCRTSASDSNYKVISGPYSPTYLTFSGKLAEYLLPEHQQNLKLAYCSDFLLLAAKAMKSTANLLRTLCSLIAKQPKILALNIWADNVLCSQNSMNCFFVTSAIIHSLRSFSYFRVSWILLSFL